MAKNMNQIDFFGQASYKGTVARGDLAYHLILELLCTGKEVRYARDIRRHPEDPCESRKDPCSCD